MKALKEFDYNLWTTEENGVKKYFVGVKATGEVTEVDAEVMKVLRRGTSMSSLMRMPKRLQGRWNSR